MHPPKHILPFKLVRGFKITQSGVPEATVGRSLSIIHPLVQTVSDSSPLSKVQLQSVVVLSHSLIAVLSSSLELNYNWKAISDNHRSLYSTELMCKSKMMA